MPEIRSHLCGMFPETNEETVDIVISTTSNVEEAIDALLTKNAYRSESLHNGM